jgi:hypothetical protein
MDVSSYVFHYVTDIKILFKAVPAMYVKGKVVSVHIMK